MILEGLVDLNYVYVEKLYSRNAHSPHFIAKSKQTARYCKTETLSLYDIICLETKTIIAKFEWLHCHVLIVGPLLDFCNDFVAAFERKFTFIL